MTGSRDGHPGAEYVCEALVDADVDLLVGLPGTQTLPIDRIVTEHPSIEYLMAKHETAIPHVAWGYYESGGGLAATLTVPGPGDTNVMHGLRNALEDGVPIIHLSADIHPGDRGKRAIHEIDPHTFDNVVKENVVVREPVELGTALERGIQTALSPPRGPVRLGIPSTMLGEHIQTVQATVDPERIEHDIIDICDEAGHHLATASRPVIYVGKEVRRANGGPRGVRDLAELLDAPVLGSLKGKGAYSEDESRFVGITGGHLPAGGRAVLDHADVVLALGTDFNGITTADWTLPMGDTLIHVSLNGFNPAYEPDLPIVANVTTACNAIAESIRRRDRSQSWDGERIGRAVRAEYEERLSNAGVLSTTDAYTPGVLRALRDILPREAVVSTDIGGHRLWATQTFETYDPASYVTAGSWAGMGVGLPAAIGAKVANPDLPVVCLTGDGGLMMCIHELHTAAEHDLDVVVVVLNDADYGIVSQLASYDERPFRWNSPDFVGIAEGFGCQGTRVTSAEAAAEAVDQALAREQGPELVDVILDRDDPSGYDIVGDESAIDLPD